MISVNDISFYVGGRALFEGASLHITSKDKIALVGLNGSGKTTLLRILSEEYPVDKGSITRSKSCTIGFLNQDLFSYETQDSILSVAMSAFGKALEIQKKIENTLRKLETSYNDKLVENLSKYQEVYETLEGYSLQAKAEEILEGIGFETSDLHRPLIEFSGGWRMRVMLAKLLLEKPSLLLLDEPSNHLDLPSIEWIENYLRNYEGAYIVVSHDRIFLNNVTQKTVEVDHRDLVLYTGNYDFYVQEKSLRNEIQKNAFENQQQKIKQTKRFITRFRAKATKARQVQSKIKSLNRMEKVEEVADSNPTVHFRFDFKQKSGRHIVQLENTSKAYGDVKVFVKASAHIQRGDKIALIGANGKGKSTLLRIIDGSEKIQGGKRTQGYNVIQAFYAQHQLEALHLKNEILEELKQAGSGKTEQELRNVLGCFLFSDDDIFKKIKVLSGGEKSRVALAKTLISEANFLILDEPTNHLDFQSENILIQALQQYNGSFIIVSHNRYFISNTANKIWFIENRQIKEYPGNYDEYEYWRSKNEKAQVEIAPSSLKKKSSNKIQKKVPQSKGTNLFSQLNQDLTLLENRIESLENDVAQIEQQMTSTEIYSDIDKLQVVSQTYKKTKKELEVANMNWDRIAAELDGLNEN